MKRLTFALFAAALLMLAPSALAQQSMQFGARAGVSYATTRTNADIDYGSTAGFVVGAFARMGLSENLFVQPELLFVQKGSSYTFSGFGQEIEGTQKLNYLELPVLVRYQIPTGASVTPAVFAGPAVAYKISESINAGEESQDSDDAKSFDVGVVVGGGVDIHAFDFGTLTADLRYTLGLMNIAKEAEGDFSAKNGAFALSVGMLF